MAKFKKSKPWLQKNGKLKSLAALRKTAASWDANQWESYLQSQETPLREGLLDNPYHFEALGFCTLEEIHSPRQKKSLPKESKQALHAALERLTDKEKQVVVSFYWLGLSIKDVCLRSKVHRSSVKRILKRAEDKLRQFLMAEIYHSAVSFKFKESKDISRENSEKCDIPAY